MAGSDVNTDVVGRLAQVIDKLHRLADAKKTYYAQYPDQPISDAPNPNGRQAWERDVQPLIDEIELELAPLWNSLPTLWPYQYRSPDSLTWTLAMDILMVQRNPQNMGRVIQGFKLLRAQFAAAFQEQDRRAALRPAATPAPGTGRTDLQSVATDQAAAPQPGAGKPSATKGVEQPPQLAAVLADAGGKGEEKPGGTNGLEPPVEKQQSRPALREGSIDLLNPDSVRIQQIERDLSEAESLVAEWIPGPPTVEHRQSVLDHAQNEVQPRLEKAWWLFDRQAILKDPILANLHDRLWAQLYGAGGLLARLREVKKHRENLEKVRYCVDELTETMNTTLSTLQRHFAKSNPSEMAALEKLTRDLSLWRADTPFDYLCDGESSSLALMRTRQGVCIQDVLRQPFDDVLRELEFLKEKPIDDLVKSLREQRQWIFDEMDRLRSRQPQATADPQNHLPAAEKEQTTAKNKRKAKPIVLTDYQQQVFDEIAGSQTSPTSSDLQKRLPARRKDADHPDPKTLRPFLRTLKGYGLIERLKERQGEWTLTLKGREFAQTQNQDDSQQ